MRLLLLFGCLGCAGGAMVARRAFCAGLGAATCTVFAPAARAADPFTLAPPKRSPLEAKWLENIRILLQDQADSVSYGGEVISPPPTVVLP